jgi:hypothetical protein
LRSSVALCPPGGYAMKSSLTAFTFILLASLVTCPANCQVLRNGSCKVDAEVFLLPQCALETRDGHVFVAKEYLPLYFSSGSARLASAVLPEDGWAYFDRHGLIVVRNVANFDNGPSPFHYGLVRVNRKSKWGLADSRGTLVVPLTYDGMLEYEESNRGWRVCTGCRWVSAGEYGWFEGGNWYWLDRNGKVAGKAESPISPGKLGIK